MVLGLSGMPLWMFGSVNLDHATKGVNFKTGTTTQPSNQNTVQHGKESVVVSAESRLPNQRII